MTQNRCIQKRFEANDVTAEEIKWLRVDYEIRCVQLVALCMLGARKSDATADNTPFLVRRLSQASSSPTPGLTLYALCGGAGLDAFACLVVSS